MNVGEIRNSQNSIPTRAPQKRTGARFEEQLENTTPATESTPVSMSDAAPREEAAAITHSEREYFEQLFPNAKDEIRTYNPYQRNDRVSVKLGTIVDRKG